ncbi:MAG: alpha/beta hydrolase [Planctomycetes bacterium]|nr:alpha/beta hydrolase [Planctomycetota bacterium]
MFAPFLRALPEGVVTTVVRYPRNEELWWAELLRIVEGAIPVGEDFCLVAESFSGPLAIELAAGQPAGLKALVLCTSFCSNPLRWGLRWLTRLARPRLFKCRMPRGFVRRFLLGPGAASELTDWARSVMASVAPGVTASRARLIHSVDASPALARVTVPVLYMEGRGDRVVGSRGWDQVQAALPTAQHAILDGPHLLLQRLPSESAERIMQFLADSAALKS